MHRYIDTIELLHREPEKWLPQKTVRHIKMFLSGFLCVDIIGTENADLLVPLVNGFARFLASKYGKYYLDYSAEVALCHAGYDDDESFEVYFSEWTTFYGQWSKASGLTTIENAVIPVVDLSKVLRAIKSKPNLYLLRPSIEMLYSFIRGAQRSCECYAPRARVEPNLGAYEVWLCDRSPLRKLCRWDRLLLAENYFDERAAIAKFFETLDEFRKQGVGSA